jgi:hypothetical protein
MYFDVLEERSNAQKRIQRLSVGIDDYDFAHIAYAYHSHEFLCCYGGQTDGTPAKKIAGPLYSAVGS